MTAPPPLMPQLPGLAELPQWLAQIVAHHEALKIRFATYVGISDWELHTHLGMLIFVAVAILFRRSMASPWPMLVAIGVECLNEYFDKLAYASWRWEDTSRDFLFTLLWPILLFLLVRSGVIRGR